MTLDEWFDKLAETRAKFHWELRGGAIRTHVDGVRLDPITGVYADATGKLVNAAAVASVPDEYMPPSADSIVWAADGDTHVDSGEAALRRRMLQTLGLEAI